MSLLFTGIFVAFAVFITAVIMRQKMYGISKKYMWCVDKRPLPNGKDMFLVECGKSGNPIHTDEDTPPGMVKVYEPTGWFGRGHRREHVIEANDYRIEQAPKNSRSTHPLFNAPTIHIGIHNSRQQIERELYRTKQELDGVEEAFGIMRDRMHEHMFEEDETFKRAVKKVEQAKEAASFPFNDKKKR